MVTLKSKPDLIVRPDNSILFEIWDKLWKCDVIRSVDINSFSVSVVNGVVLLTGHLSRASNRGLIEDIAHAVPDVIAVNNKLVTDDELSLQVAEALGNDERIRGFVLPVGCSHGWIHLGGEVPTRELQLGAEEVAGQVQSVRGVVSLPKVAGESRHIVQSPLQPLIQSRIYDHNMQEGVVTHVVIQPLNRLVTHAVVSTDDFRDGKYMFNEYLVPVEEMEVVNRESIFLKRNGPPLNTFPAFELSDCPLAPLDWQPPYPYSVGTVRWPREQHEKAMRELNSN
ncbi:MAG: BON domain-containing protein [Anaerolineales bacterium]